MDFKFFQKNPKRLWLESNLPGQLQWLNQPVGEVLYMDRRWDGNFYTEELKTMTVIASSRYFYSYNEFIQMNRNKNIFVYEFIDNSDITNMIHYKEDNFDNMPRDIRFIFRGIIKNNESI